MALVPEYELTKNNSICCHCKKEIRAEEGVNYIDKKTTCLKARCLKKNYTRFSYFSAEMKLKILEQYESIWMNLYKINGVSDKYYCMYDHLNFKQVKDHTDSDLHGRSECYRDAAYIVCSVKLTPAQIKWCVYVNQFYITKKNVGETSYDDRKRSTYSEIILMGRENKTMPTNLICFIFYKACEKSNKLCPILYRALINYQGENAGNMMRELVTIGLNLHNAEF